MASPLRVDEQRADARDVSAAPVPSVVRSLAPITGTGYSLVYPGFGLEAVRHAPPEAKGLAMGAITAFLDLALGVAAPALGLVADHSGLSSVFLVSTIVTLAAAVVAMRLRRAPSAARFDTEILMQGTVLYGPTRSPGGGGR